LALCTVRTRTAGGVHVRLGHRRILSRLDQRVEMLDELPHVVPGQHPGHVQDSAEEARHVLDLGLLTHGAGARHPAQPPAVGEELIEEIAGPLLGGQPEVALQLLDEPGDRLGALRGERRAQLGRLVEAAEDVEEPAVPPVRVRRAPGEIGAGHTEEPGLRQVGRGSPNRRGGR
jgi:hypothetical protein